MNCGGGAVKTTVYAPPEGAKTAANPDIPVHDAPNGGVRETQFSEDQLGLAFTERHAQDLRYVAPWYKWFQWTGTHWQHETTLLAFNLARKICREAAAQCNKTSEGKNISRAKTVAAVEQLAKADRAMVAIIEQWDTDKDLLNTPGGAINLKTGELRPHSRDDYCTKITAVSPGGNCPMFREFLNRIFAGDKDLIAYIQTALGYCLTGDIREHAMFFGYGTGANGKGVLLSTVAGVMGSYCKTAHQDTFTTTGGTQHPTDVAGLIGARLVICGEVEQGRRWAEAKIKSLTGGDRISARFMRQDFFEFAPQFKLFITGNHKPGLRNIDEAMRRRLHLIPFTVTIPEGERDKRLLEKLRKEWPGILQWMIEGAVRWHAEGLKKPQAVEDATREYLESEDTLLMWIEDRCQRDKRDETHASRLFASWKAWCELTGEFTGTARQFGMRLAEHGFASSHSRTGKMYRGISLLEAESKTWAEHW
jgi:putative DNA primase/helicase